MEGVQLLRQDGAPRCGMSCRTVRMLEEMEARNRRSNKKKNLVVHRLAVLPNHQGKGLARKLMDFAENFAKEKNYDAIRLDTFSQNPRNQKFYSNRGYTNLGPVYLKYKKDHPYFCYELLL